MMKRLWNKKVRSLVIVIFAVMLTLVAFSMNQNYVKDRVDTEKIIVAAENIPPFTAIEGKTTTREVVRSEVPEDAIRSLTELDESGPYFTGELGFVKGAPLQKQLIKNSKGSRFGPAAELSKDEDALYIGITTDQARSAGDYIRPGVLVDAFVFIPGDMDRRPEVIGPKQNPNMKGLLVHDRQTSDGTTPGEEGQVSQIPTVAILKVKSDVARDLVMYQETGKIYLMPHGYDPQFEN